jgi:hypothetical protein
VDIEGTIRAATRLALAEEAGRAARRPPVGREEAFRHISEIKRLLTSLGVGVLSVELAGRDRDGGVDLRIVFDDGWEPLDEGWGPEDSMTAIFNALESRGYRHVPGTSGFDGGSTVFVKGGVSFNFVSPSPPG